MISKTEKYVTLFVFCLLFVALATVQVRLWYYGYGDNTFLAEALENVAKHGKPLTQVAPSILKALEIFVIPTDQACIAPLGALNEINQFKIHVYAILYLIAPLAMIFSVPFLLPCLMTGSFVGMLTLLYLFLRRQKVGPLGAVVFCFLVSIHPAWSAALFGQSYVDRLFIILGFAYVASLHLRSKLWQIGLLGLACTLVNDRTGILTAAITIGYLILFYQNLKGRRIFLLCSGVIFFFYSYFLIGYFISNATPTPPPLSQIFHFFPYQIPELRAFVGASLFLLVLSLFEWRAAILAVGMMLPNVFVSIGGAEKVGWSTHYHSYYLPVLAWAAALGYARINTILLSSKFIRLSAIIPLSLGLVASYYSPSGKYLTFDNHAFYSNAWWRTFVELKQSFDGYIPDNPFFAINKTLPKNVSVMMPEAGMPILYPNRKLYLMPAGLDVADYAIFLIVGKNKDGYIYGDINPVAAEAKRSKQNTCFLERMRNLGYDLQNPEIFGSYALIRRNTHLERPFTDQNSPGS